MSGPLSTGVPYIPSAFVPSHTRSDMVSRSRNQLADFQAQQAAKKQAEAQSKQKNWIQAEQRAIEARLREATHTPEPLLVPDIFKGWVGRQPSIERPNLVRMQRILNQYFGEAVFDRVDMEYPYAVENGKRVAEPNIFRLAAILDWILFQDRSDGRWSDQELELLEASQDVENWLPDEKKRQLKLAAKLHGILVKNEEKGEKRDDARAFADGFKAIIDGAKILMAKLIRNRLSMI